MAKSYIDFFETLKYEFVGALKFKNRFKRLWGTELVDGIEVLKSQKTVYPGTSDLDVQNLLKLLGARDSINNANFDGIVRYYFWLNPSKADTLDQEDIRDILTDRINNYVGVNKKVNTYLVFTDKNDPMKFNNWTKEQILLYVENNYDELYNSLSGIASGETLIDATIGGYLLFDNNQHFEITITKATVSALAISARDESVFGSVSRVTNYVSQIAIEIEATQNSLVTSTSNIITHMVDEQSEINRTGIQMLAESTYNEPLNGESFFRKARVEKTDYIWYKGQMRVDFLDNKEMKTRDKIKILVSAIDTGYVQKKTKWYKKVLGFVLIVASIVISIVTVGWGAPLSTMLMAIGTAVGISTLAMTVIQSYWAKHGDPAAAGYMGRWIKIGSIISLIAGITNIIMNISKQAAIEAAKQSLIQGGATAAEATAAVTAMDAASITSFNVANGVTVGISNYASAVGNMLFSSVTSGWQSMVSTGMKVAKVALDTISKMRMNAYQSEVNTLTEENAKVSAELEDINDKEVHIGIENIKWYTDNLRIDNQRFDVNYLYEGTKMNIGRPSFYTAKGFNIISSDVYDVNKF